MLLNATDTNQAEFSLLPTLYFEFGALVMAAYPGLEQTHHVGLESNFVTSLLTPVIKTTFSH